MSIPTNQNAIIRMPHYHAGKWHDAAVLGVGTDSYTPIQNIWLLEAFEAVAKIYRPETLGVLKEGEVVFFTLNAGMFDVRVNGRDDAHNAYIYGFDRKTPGSKLIIGVGGTRVVCWNTLQSAEENARILVPLQHSKGVHELIEAIATALRSLGSAQEAHRQALQMMADHTLSVSQAESVFSLAWPTPKLSATILSLDTLNNPIDSPINSQVDVVANALAKVAQSTTIQDRISKAEEELVRRTELVEYLRETAGGALRHMADDEGLGINGYTVLNAVSETLEHRSDRVRGDVAADMLIGSRSMVMERVSQHLIQIARN